MTYSNDEPSEISSVYSIAIIGGKVKETPASSAILFMASTGQGQGAFE
jgi:hypothetical protein